ncbi:Glycine/D-amino acid oxidase [Sulfobacillus thermosulfidooxidans DSM 9293]|uniref:Glycine/D-amino acid oxidase n=1 Tax=Sulfobacillus thermosulfidooxidans (strain DSM 9293 / VKM B-1269 / AT-1) TaxID=929705 RepID=A0A1W1WKC4_SULTA|nr:FAD-dependent oxidoreductase [Sulfobacillus thermosulfidooxidans]SMC06737.1 Glycine/D-amino acid oxidase [Sulfobacillus thermosulfidooxidans DSM 9293]
MKMIKGFDVAVIGSGIIGLFAAYWARQKGLHVIVFDQHHPPHRYGSSHGLNRAIEYIYQEPSQQYLPWIQRTWELWRSMHQTFAPLDLLAVTGAVTILVETDPRIAQLQTWAENLDVPFKILGPASLRSRFSQLSISRHVIGIEEPSAAMIAVEPFIRSMIAWGQEHNIPWHFNEKVLAVKAHPDHVTIKTADTDYTAARAIVTPGPWLSQWGLNIPITLSRQLMLWVPKSSLPLSSMVNIDLLEDIRIAFFPEPQERWGTKIIADVPLTAGEKTCSAISVEDILTVNDQIRPIWSGIDRAPLIHHEPCIMSMTPDQNFYIDYWPGSKHIVIGAGFSGRGFKYAPLVGQWLVNMVMQEPIEDDLSLFRINRIDNLS